MSKVLIVDDDITFSKILTSFLNKNGYETIVAHSLKEACMRVKNEAVNLLLLDYRLPDGTGIDVLEFINQNGLQIPAIMMTSFHDIKTAVKSIKKGARDYITKPINHEELLMQVREVLDESNAAGDLSPEEDFIKGTSELSKQLDQHIGLVAGTDMSVLINGESGTGKEHVARALHQMSKRAAHPFVAIDCGALSADLAASELFGHVKGAFTGALSDKMGQFEYAQGGTLFLDEVGNLNYDIQVKLLRALQEREISPVGSNKKIKFDVRLITATNEDFQEVMKSGQFREDLYHRLNEFKIKLPSLSERKEDLDIFISFFIKKANKELGKNVNSVSKDVKALFDTYHWPGNIRELKNIIKRCVLLADNNQIELKDLPAEMEFSTNELKRETELNSDLKLQQEEMEKHLIEKALKEVKNNKSKAAKLLNIDRTTLYYKMAKYNIEN
ncbi:MAG: sigma-54 dependent transcriptional regulator [Chitinophagaceae bacterium]|jgi:two-component system response regulator HydG